MIRQQAGTSLVLLLLSACAPLPFSGGPPLAETESCGDVIEFHNVASRLSANDGREMRQALQPNGSADDACNRLRLALLLCKPDTPFRDDAEAARLLTGFLADPATAQHPQRGLAQYLADSLVERRRLLADGQVERQRLLTKQASLEEFLTREKRRVQALTKELTQMKATAASLQKQVKAQQLQLDQLKSIEQDINAKELAVENPASGRKGKKAHE
ncbi:MAG TPA: hypothetical protein ENI94_00865 [Gammaproteobacteria bacterium]|nr:hypothetical protein [Gammaproteobacteria bacterium]